MKIDNAALVLFLHEIYQLVILDFAYCGCARFKDTQPRVTVGFTYDNVNRVTLKDLPSPESDVSYSYDLLSRSTGVSQGGYNLTFGYDALGRQTSDGQGWGTINRSYDLAGRITRRTWQDGFYVDYDRLVTGETSKVRENGATSGVGVLATYAYDNLGNHTALTFGNGAVQTYAYDAVSRLTTLTNDLSGTTNDLTIGGSSTPISYNPASQIASTVRAGDAYAWGGHYNVNRGYTSNGLNQYSAAGSASFTYDARGNLTSDGTNSYTYSSENLLKTASGGISLYYDPIGRLAEYDTSSSTRFMSDGSSVAVEVDGSSNILRRYVRGDGMDELLVWYEGSGTTNRRFLSTDERGSIVSATDSSGSLVGVNTYDEYGIPSSSNAGRFQYTGQAWLPELGTQYSKARIYSPTLGRFMQTDPIGYGDGSNWYAYVRNDPINGTDPLGLEWPDNPCPFRDGKIICTASHGGFGFGGVGGGGGGGGGSGDTGGKNFQFDAPSDGGGGGGGDPAPPPPPPQKPSVTQCATQAAKKNALGLGLDVAGLAANALAAEYTVPAAIVGSAIGAAGIGLGIAQQNAFVAGAGYVGKQSAVATGLFAAGSTGARAAGRIGWGAWAISTFVDVSSAISDFQNCRTSAR